MRTLKFTLLGTGSSGGVPRIGNDWGACDPAEPRNRRLRCSALAEVFTPGTKAPTRLLIDTSPDLREQLLRAGVDYVDAVAITHDHADQVGGFDDLRVLALRKMRQIPIYLDAPTHSTLSVRFRYCFEGEGGYPPIVDLQRPFLEPGTPIEMPGGGGVLTFRPIEQIHGRIRSLGFRIGGLAYCNDLSAWPEESLQYLGGLDTLVVDALRYTPHPSHAHLDQTLKWIDELRPKQAILTNLHVDMDYQTLVHDLPHHIRPGYDGLCLTLPVP